MTTLSDLVLAELWPRDFFAPPDLPTFLDAIQVVDFEYGSSESGTVCSLLLATKARLALAIPGFEGAELALQAGPSEASDTSFGTPPATGELDFELEEPLISYSFNGLTFVQAELLLGAQPALIFPNLSLVLRFHSDVLKRVGPDGQAQDGPVEISLPGSLRVDGSFNVTFEGFDAVNLSPVMIGSTGIVISADGIMLDLSRTSSPQEIKDAGFGDDFLGVFLGEARLQLPAGMSGIPVTEAILQNAAIGSGGVSGTAMISNGAPVFDDVTRTYVGKGAGSLFGMQFWLSDLKLTVKKNAFIESSATGELVLPFFNRRVAVKLGFDGTGSVTAQVTGVVEPGDTMNDQGLFSFNVAGQLKFDIPSLAIENIGGRAQLRMPARVTPTVGNLKWPTFEIKELVVDSDGNVRVDGGWIDLPKQATLDFHGFKLEISKIGFGAEDDGSKWIGFSGGMRIAAGFPAGASVDGLRIRWKGSDISLSLNGIAIDMEVANVLSLKGRAKFENEEIQGAVKLGLDSPKLLLDGQFRAGSITRNGVKSSFFAVFVDVQLPTGVPLGTSGLSLYGVAGLFGYNFEPDRGPSEGWYHNQDFSKGWFPKEPAGVTGLAKWRPTPGSLSFGAGVTIGTSADDGHKFNGRLVLVLVFPGPIIILEGRANLFKKRAKLLEGEPNFLAAAIYDGRAGTFVIGLDAQYKYKSKGELLDVRGSAEAFFNLRNRNDWHLYLGQQEPNKRVRARAFQLFDVNAFFMLDPRTLDIGSGWAFARSWSFGRLSVGLSASFEKEAIISFKPNHFTGIMAMQGRAELRAFGRSVGVSANAQVRADVFDPKHIRGDFKVGINLPWPLPDISKTVVLEWTSPLNRAPPLPLPLRDATIEHGKSALRWPVERGLALIPNNDQGGLEWRGPGKPATAPDNTFNPPAGRPFVAADSKLSLVFGRAIQDPSMIGNNPTTVPADVVGDVLNKRSSYTVKYALKSVVLQKRAPSASLATPEWVTVARKGENMTATEVALYGSWIPETPPELPPAASGGTAHSQVKLVLNAKSPFESTALVSPEWHDWFEENHAGYPCPPATDTSKLCADFAGFEDGNSFPNLFEFEDPPFTLRYQDGGVIAADDTEYRSGLRVATRGSASPGSVRVIPPPGATEVRISVGTPLSLVHEPPEFSDPRGTFQPSDIHAEIDVLDGSVRVSTFDASGVRRQTNSVGFPAGQDDLPALFIGSDGASALLVPAEPALVVELELDVGLVINGGERADNFANIELYASATATAPFHTEVVPFGQQRYTIRLRAPAIAKVRIVALTTDSTVNLRRVYFRTPVVAHVLRGVFDGTFPVYREENGVVVARDEDIKEVFLGSRCGGEFLIKELCLPNRRADQIGNAFLALDQFKQDDELFEPETDYRLVVNTRRTDKDEPPPGFTKGPGNAAAVNADNFFEEHVYFRVAGPPGVGLPKLAPKLSPSEAPEVTGLEDLRLYVKRTVPEAVPAGPEGKPTLPRGIYRAYDLEVEFNENYVESMYKRARRDLTLRVYYGTNEPLRDRTGRVLIGPSSWARSANGPVKSSTERWIRMVNGATCREGAPFDPNAAQRDQSLSAPDERVLLAPETLVQARLVPALLRESFVAPLALFADGQSRRLERWRAENSGDTTHWEIRFEPVIGPDGQPTKLFYVTETSGRESTLLYEGPIAAEDTTDKPTQWSDVRAAARLRWETGEVGLELRRGASGVIRVVLDRSAGMRRLIFDAVVREHPATFPEVAANVDLTLECVGNRVLVLENGEVVFDEAGAPVGNGPLGLYAKNAAVPRFSEVSVDDLRPNPATAFKFDFVSSKYVNFYDHVHDLDDRSFAAPLEAAALATPALLALLQRAVPYADTVSDDERRACEELLEKLLGVSGALARPERLEALRVTRGGEVIALLLRSPDPLLWDRIALNVEQSSTPHSGTIPGTVKLSGVSFTGPSGEPESVAVLARETTSISGYRLEFRAAQQNPSDDLEWTEYYRFADGETASEGTQIQVFSTASDTAPAREPGTAQRFVFDDPALVHDFFAGASVELRLLSPGGAVVHQRVFLASDAHSTLDFRVLRKPDGTELFILAPPAAGQVTPLGASHLRLSWKFQRNKSSNPVVLRQAGSSTAESAVLDVPLT